MSIQQEDIEVTIASFTSKRDACNRYASYDYCFNYFHPSNNTDITSDMEKSCLSLGFYLASWGMYRGSSFLLGKSVKIFIPTIEYISELDRSAWEIDAINLEEKKDEIIDIYQNIRSLLIPQKAAHLTLTTKIMLGVFGSVPAYDRFFIKSFKEIFKGKCGFTSFNKNSLICINEFYLENQDKIDQESEKLSSIKFNDSTGSHPYKKSKLIDMYGYSKGLNA